MGNVLSSASTRVHVTSESETMSTTSDSRDQEDSEVNDEVFLDAIKDDEARAKSKEDEMVEFRKELSIKREQRRQILDRHRSEKQELEKSLNQEKKSRMELSEANKLLRELLTQNNIEIPDVLQVSSENYDLINTITQMKEEFEDLKTNNNKLRSDLAHSNSALQNAYSDIADVNAQNIESMKQISALKEVVTVSKTMINLREEQLNEVCINNRSSI
jgi:DNA repair exonuclease SbcCD ATPase subunit